MHPSFNRVQWINIAGNLIKLLYEVCMWSCSVAKAKYLRGREGGREILMFVPLFVQERTRTRSWMWWCMKPGGSTGTVNCWETACRGSAGTVSAYCLYPADVFIYYVSSSFVLNKLKTEQQEKHIRHSHSAASVVLSVIHF